MLKLVLRIVIVLLVVRSNAQNASDEIVLFSGKVLSAKDSIGIVANVLYEKLPYYDDMGIMQSKADGTFDLKLVNDKSYTFTFSSDGFKELSQKVTVIGDESLGQNQTFYIKSDEIELIKLDNLIFARASATISQSSFQELDDLAIWMNENPSIVIQLEGHTDFRGNSNANFELSRARVESVKTYLVDQSVKKNRILTKAYGGTQPLSKEDTEEAKQLNRRVEVRVIRR